MNNTPLEDQECHTLVDYLEILKQQGKVIVFSHTANETYTRSWNQKRRNTAMGVRSGIPDYVIVTRKYTLFLEMKRVKGGVVSPTQKKWIKAIENTGVPVAVCKGFDEAKIFVDKYLR